jgi:cation diffusion facilitator family transporter
MEKEEEARGVESEVAVDVTSPSRTGTKSGKGEGGSWKLNAQTISDDFEANSPETKNKLVQGYATSQRDMIEDFLQIDKKFKEDSSVGEEAAFELGGGEKTRLINGAINASFFSNILLLCVKILAAVTSGSMAVVASTVDTGLDIFTGAIIYATQKMKNKKAPYKYPQGKSRLEPLGVIVFASIMGVTMLGLLREALAIIIDRLLGAPAVPINVDLATIIILAFNVVLKVALYVFCRWVDGRAGSAIVEAYGEDHRNDVLSNTLVIAAALVAGNVPSLWFLDSACAIILCAYIISDWFSTAKDQIQMLAGRSAGPEFLTKITYIAYQHDSRVVKIDTVRAYHFGLKYLVECHIVLPEDMPLKEAHDIGETLEIKIESMEEVERAFVHLDTDWEHKPEHGDPYEK